MNQCVSFLKYYVDDWRMRCVSKVAASRGRVAASNGRSDKTYFILNIFLVISFLHIYNLPDIYLGGVYTKRKVFASFNKMR